MKMGMKQRKAIVAGMMAVTLCMGVGISVRGAEPSVPEIGLGNADIEKNLHVAEGIDIPNTTFRFHFEGVDDAPKILDQEISYTKDDSNLFQSNKVTKKAEDILSGVVFPHAGEFTYKLTEIAGSTELEGGTMTYDTSVWTLRVYVKNGENGKTEISNITASKEGNKQEKIAFDNKFEKTTSLIVEKQIEGALADRTKKFEFTIQFQKSPTLEQNKTSFITSDNKEYEYGKEYPFQLSDDEKIVFDNLPAGTTYEVIEKGAKDKYVPSVKVEENGNSAVEAGLTRETEEQSLSSTAIHKGEKLNLAGEKKNYVVFTNTLDEKDVPITGVMLNEMPYILFMGAAAVGLGVYFVIKRRCKADK